MATRHMNLSQEPLAQRITSGLIKIYLALRSQTWKTSGTNGIAPAQGQILLFLRSRPHRTPTVSDIAKNLAVTPGSVSQAVRGLARNRLVRKFRSGPDARCVTLTLTAKGRRRADRTLKWSDFLTRATATLHETEQEALLHTLLKLMLVLQERGEVPPTRMCPTCRHFQSNVHADPKLPHHCAAFDAPLGDGMLRIECPAHDTVMPENHMSHRRDVPSETRGPMPGPKSGHKECP